VGFREKFLGSNKAKNESFHALSSFGTKSTLLGWKADQTSFNTLQKLVQKTFQQSIDRVVHRQITADSELLLELKQQEVELNYLIEKFNHYPDLENLADCCQQVTDYLGMEFSQVRWVMEPYTTHSQQSFQKLMDSLSEPIQQTLKEGIKCFEIGEYTFAKEQINNVLASNRTNYFAYQYLGFIGVLEDDSETALVNFKLARKFAESDYQQALALSHLAISCYALDEQEKAIELADRATQQYPLLARFWYQLAKYKSLLPNGNCSSALQNAIKCDWIFWGVAIVDTHFDNSRREINQLFTQLRQQQKEQTLSSISNLKKAITTVKQIGVTNYNLSKPTTTFTNLEERFTNAHIFSYLDLIFEAEECHKNVFLIAEKYLKERISEKRSFLTQQDSNKARELKELESPIATLIQEKKELKQLYKGLSIGCGGHILLNIFSLVLIICLVLFFSPQFLIMPPSTNVNYLNLAILLLLSTVATVILAMIISHINYTNKVTLRGRKIDTEIQNKKRDARQLKAKIEEDSKIARTKVEEELKNLEAYLEVCQNKRYL